MAGTLDNLHLLHQRGEEVKVEVDVVAGLVALHQDDFEEISGNDSAL